MMSGHQLIGAEVSYYTGKVRAYLRYKGMAFDEVSATREVYRDIILPRTGVAFIPVLPAPARVGGLEAIETPISCRMQRKDNSEP